MRVKEIMPNRMKVKGIRLKGMRCTCVSKSVLTNKGGT